MTKIDPELLLLKDPTHKIPTHKGNWPPEKDDNLL